MTLKHVDHPLKPRFSSFPKILSMPIARTIHTDVVEHFGGLRVDAAMAGFLSRYPHTFHGLAGTPKAFLRHFGDQPLAALTKWELERWLEAIRLERDLSLATVRKWVCLLNKFFDFLVEEGIFHISPLRRIKFPSTIPTRKPRIIFTAGEIETLLRRARAMSPGYLHPLLLTYTHTGARRSEVLNLQWLDVDFAAGTIQFRRTKNGRDRIIRIPSQLKNTLRMLPRRSPFVFTCAQGRPIRPSLLNEQIIRFQRLVPNGKDWRLHAFRHSFAHEFLKRGGQMYQLQAILGHRNIGITINLYGQLQAVEIENPSPYRF